MSRDCVTPEKVSFALEPHDSAEVFDLVIDYCSDEHRGTVVQKDCPSVDIEGLRPGTKYIFTFTRRLQSSQTSVAVVTGETENVKK